MNRRAFVGCLAAAAVPLFRPAARPFRISLNQWSLWNEFVGDTSAPDWWDVFVKNLQADPAAVLKGTLDPLDFPRLTRKRYGLEAIELESSLYFAHAKDHAYFRKLKQRCDDHGITCQLVSNVWSGNLAAVQPSGSREVARNYHPWVDAAAILGCPSLMVNVNARTGDRNAARDAAAEGLSALVKYARRTGVAILIENHGWYSSYVPWLIDIIRAVNSPFCRLNADLGNFCLRWRGEECVDQQYDPYEGIALMMPYAKAVSAKTIRFDAQGNETRIDYPRMLRIISTSGYNGYLGVEYSGTQYPGDEGVRRTIDLIRRSA